MEDQNPKPIKPVHEVRIGAIKAAIWANEGPKPNGTWHSVTFCRLFKVGDEWNQATNFTRADLLVVAKVADQAHSWILEHQQ